MKNSKENIKSSKNFAKEYLKELEKVREEIDLIKINFVTDLLQDLYENKKTLYVCGNGGSAAIANHFACDHLKGIREKTNIRPKVYSLSSNIELISAISNDIKFDDIFSFQLSSFADEDDCLLTISSSGSSKNIIKAIKWAKKNNLKTISLNGFNGGKASKISDVSINVSSKNYGIIEDIHQTIMHILAQILIKKNSSRKP